MGSLGAVGQMTNAAAAGVPVVMHDEMRDADTYISPPKDKGHCPAVTFLNTREILAHLAQSHALLSSRRKHRIRCGLARLF